MTTWTIPTGNYESKVIKYLQRYDVWEIILILIAVITAALFVYLLYLAFLFVKGSISRRIVSAGKVYAKNFVPERCKVEMRPMAAVRGDHATTELIPHRVTHPEEYIISIKDEKGRTADHYVSKEVYQKTRIGDIFSVDDSRSDLDEES